LFDSSLKNPFVPDRCLAHDHTLPLNITTTARHENQEQIPTPLLAQFSPACCRQAEIYTPLVKK
jgi:hypothetical protein